MSAGGGVTLYASLTFTPTRRFAATSPLKGEVGVSQTTAWGDCSGTTFPHRACCVFKGGPKIVAAEETPAV